MPLTVEQLAEEAMQLPFASRALLVDKLVETLELDAPDQLQRLWAEEAIRRRDEIVSGKVQALPGEDVLSEVRRLVGR